MAEPFLSEIRIMSFNFAPKGWALCNGQLLPINQNQALFSLLGTTFGGDGRVNFALPNLRDRVPIGVGEGHTLGESGGQASHTVTMSEMPAHTHFAHGSSVAANTNTASANALLGVQASTYTGPANLTAMSPGEIGNSGGSQPHENRQPFLALNFSIALQGIFPSPT
jgi:microcystin-dependent protein